MSRRRSAMIVVLLCSCGSAPHVAEQVVSKRDVTINLGAEHGDSAVTVDGKERLHAQGGSPSNLVIDLKEGDHKMALVGSVEEFGGVGVSFRLAIRDTGLLDLKCDFPCTQEQLDTWGTPLRGDPTRLAFKCAGAEIRDLAWSIDEKKNVQVSFNLALEPPVTPSVKAARGCP